MCEDDPTADLAAGEKKLNQILAELAEMKADIAALKQQSQGTTRPLLDRIIAEVIATRETLTRRADGVDGKLERIEAQLRVLT